MKDEQIEQPVDNNVDPDEEMHELVHVKDMYKDWFLEYASYVILERAVPALNDGLKPVQRRILHSMKRMDDGRFNKVANIIGHTMQFHPHGDAAIGDAIVNLGQKDLLIETQGNWGDVRTGDRSAAPRYIEARLSKFAKEIAFNNEITEWQASYDGRNNEPIHLPVKFPLVLAQGAEGIAVGLSTKILPHNFIELLQGAIDILDGKPVELFPDFATGGMADVSDYNEGKKGGRVRVRSHLEVLDRKHIKIRDIPYGTTTVRLIDSIIKANDNGKIKISRVIDNTAQDVDIVVEIPSGVSPEVTVDALYAFTDCEVSIAPNCCVILDEKPCFLSVNEFLKKSTTFTVGLLRKELEVKKNDLEEKWHFASLERIFIEKKIYRDIEECETWESVISTIDEGLEPYKAQLLREVTREDIIKLTEIKIKRISKYDSDRAEEAIKALEGSLKDIKHNLKHITSYAKDYFLSLINKFGQDKDRKTELRSFDTIQATQVAIANKKLYVNRAEGFVGLNLKKDEFVCECSDLDDIIVFMADGRYLVTRVSEKSFAGKNILYVGVWKKGDSRMVYNAVYKDGKSGTTFIKRFSVTSSTRDKVYDLTKGNPGSRVLYFSANPNGEAEVVGVHLSQSCKAKKKSFEFDFAELTVKGRGSRGNILTRYPVLRVILKTAGTSTLGGLKIWYDDAVGRLNTESRGRFLGVFESDDMIVTVTKDGVASVTSYELTNRYEPDQIYIIRKFIQDTVFSCVYFDGERHQHFVKRFQLDNPAPGKRYTFIGEHKDSTLQALSIAQSPVLEVELLKGRSGDIVQEDFPVEDLVGVKGWKALGNKLSKFPVCSVCFNMLEDEKSDAEEDKTEDGNTEDIKETSNVDENEKDETDTDAELIDQMDLFKNG